MSLDHPLNGEQQAPTEPPVQPEGAPVEEMSPLTAPLQRAAGELEAVTSVEEPMHASGEPKMPAEGEASAQSEQSPSPEASAPAPEVESPPVEASAQGPAAPEPTEQETPASEAAAPEAATPVPAVPVAPPPARTPPSRPGLASLAQLFEAGRVHESGEEAVSEATLMRRRGESAPALIAIERIDEDVTFQVRPLGDISRLATDIARVGQLFPVDVRLLGADRFQVVCGFRRVAAMRFLQRDFVLARVHTELSDEDALLMALAAAIHAEPVAAEELEAVRERLDEEGRLFAAARDMLEKALQTDDGLAPEGVEEEVDADELAADAAQRLGALNQDLSLLADVFLSLDESRRAELLMQLRYSAELVAYLEGLKG